MGSICGKDEHFDALGVSLHDPELLQVLKSPLEHLDYRTPNGHNILMLVCRFCKYKVDEVYKAVKTQPQYFRDVTPKSRHNVLYYLLMIGDTNRALEVIQAGHSDLTIWSGIVGDVPLIKQAHSCHETVFFELLKYPGVYVGKYVHIYSDDLKYSFTPLMYLCSLGIHPTGPLALIEYGSDINHIDNNTGETALHYACSTGMDTVAIELLRRGCSTFDKKDNFGATPLMEACDRGMSEVALEILKREPANLLSVGNCSLVGTAWSMAHSKGLKEVEHEILRRVPSTYRLTEKKLNSNEAHVREFTMALLGYRIANC